MRKRSMAIDFASIFDVLPFDNNDPDIVRRDGEQLSDPQTVFADLYVEAHERPRPKLSNFTPEVTTVATSTPSNFHAAMTQNAFGNQPWLSSDKSGQGIASLIDVAAAWREVPVFTTIKKDGATYEAIGLSDVEMYRVELGGAEQWLKDPLVRIRLLNQASLWIMMIPRPESETNLACCAFALSGPRRILQKTSDFGTRVVLPTTRLECTPDLTWAHGLGEGKQGGWYVEQAHQRVNLLLSDQGSNLLVDAPPVRKSQQSLVIDQGFMCFFTSDEDEGSLDAVRMPLFPSYVDIDSWERAD